ncbi:MAG: ABC transporter ATP-binding protein [Gemmatimonadetes bacterium]|nr:ABC transporter ATP-binding protein [Gemmatimonadota bacterium]
MRVEAKDLVCRYGVRWRKGRPALRGVEFDAAGPVVGLVGPNGAGKTTLLRCVAGFLAPSAGAVTVAGLDPVSYRRRHGIGYLPERMALPAYARVESFLRTVASLRRDRSADAVEEVIRWTAIEGVRRERIGNLSRGFQKRVALALVELGRPPFLVLDEPTNGLDPIAIHDLRERVAGWRADGRLVLVSSHQLDEVQRLADEVLLLWEGRVRAHLTREELSAKGPGSLDAWFAERPWQAGERRHA